MRRARPVAIGLAVALVAGLLAVGLLRGRTAASAAAGPVVDIHSVHGASFLPALQGSKPLFILAIGSDARPGGDPLHSRGDSIHIIGIDPAHQRATILGFPRDSWVAIPGHGTTKITSALTFGGPALMAQTLENLTGIKIDFWILTTFGGLSHMVDSIGGLSVRIPMNLSDKYSGAFLKAGIRHLNGGRVLAFARDRHDFPTGDLARSANQGTILIAALTQLHRVIAKDPSALLIWIAAAWHNIHTDLSIDVVLDLALAATQIPSANVNNVVVPATTGTIGAASVVFISSSAQAIYADMRADGIVGH
jgi:polyisoprenyl-teichoic acid--peptidoglycan teichoic acid transferase